MKFILEDWFACEGLFWTTLGWILLKTVELVGKTTGDLSSLMLTDELALFTFVIKGSFGLRSKFKIGICTELNFFSSENKILTFVLKLNINNKLENFYRDNSSHM